MILPIINHPHPILRKKTAEMPDLKDPEIKRMALDMLETLDAVGGLGLAAPQVGSSMRLSVIKLDGKSYVLLNPKIKSKSLRKEIAEEGCLSFPGLYFPVKRHKKVKVQAFDLDGKTIEISAEGLLARAFQHEIDHLDGVLFIDRNKSYKKYQQNERKKN